MIMKYIGQSFKRGCVQLVRRPMYFLLIVIMPILCSWFLMDLIKGGSVQLVPVGIVDQDNSDMSRRISRNLNGFQQVDISHRYNNFAEARDAMQRDEIYAFMVIPEKFYADILAFQQPKISYYMNQAYLMGASLTMKELTTMANLAPAAVQRELLRARGYNDNAIMGLIQPIVLDSHLIGNPYMNYPAYLLTTVFPGILGLIILLTTTYSMGVELKHKTSRQWLKTARKSYFAAIFGKMLPYTILYLILELAGIILMFLVFKFPMEGNLAFYMLGSIIYIITMQCIGVFFIGIAPVISTAISLSVLYGILALTMSGFTFPLEYMPPAIQGLSILFPLRSFYLFTVDTTLFGLSIAQTAKYLPMIAVFMFLPFITSKRLLKALIHQNYPAI